MPLGLNLMSFRRSSGGSVAGVEPRFGHQQPCVPIGASVRGFDTYEGFRYLIEARWRVNAPDVQAIAALAHKASRNFSSTRGLFLSIVGFRPEVVRELETGNKNVLLMSGQEFSLILDGTKSLPEALQLKLDEGSKKGHIFYDLARETVV
jgi:hypothetical protein